MPAEALKHNPACPASAARPAGTPCIVRRLELCVGMQQPLSVSSSLRGLGCCGTSYRDSMSTSMWKLWAIPGMFQVLWKREAARSSQVKSRNLTLKAFLDMATPQPARGNPLKNMLAA